MISALKNGFTLVELLVVIAVIALTALIATINFRYFSQVHVVEQRMKDAQSFIQNARASATTSSLCGTSGGALWIVEFQSDRKTINLKCKIGSSSALLQKTLELKDSIEVSSIIGSAPCGPSPLFPLGEVSIQFAPLSGSTSFSGVDRCLQSSQAIKVTFKNLKNNSEKILNINRSGNVYE